MAVASLVLGIIGTVASCLFFLLGFVVGIPLSMVALLLGILARKKAVAANEPTSVATGGLVLGVIGLVIGVAMLAMCGSLIGKAKEAHQTAQQRKLNNQEFNDIFNKAIEQDNKDKPPEKK